MSFETVIDSGTMKRIAGSFPTGVAVISAASKDGALCGLTLNAVMSLSLDPPQFLISIAQSSSTLAAIRESRALCINFLAVDQAAICNVFATKAADKFAAVPFRKGALGCPVIEGTVSHAECRVAEIIEGGDHAILVGTVEAFDVSDRIPMLYHRGRFVDPSPSLAAIA